MPVLARSPSVLPPVIMNLMIINALCFFAQQIPPLDFYLNVFGALWPLGAPDVVNVIPYGPTPGVGFYPWQIVTTAFLHADLWHLGFNLYGLFLFGRGVEQALGTKRFAILFGASVLGSSALQLGMASAILAAGGGLQTAIGASGGLLGVVAACAILFPRDEILLFPFPVPIQMKWLAVGYVALDLLGATGVTGGNTAHFAHLGGFAAGALLIQYWRGRLPIRPRVRLA